MGFWKRFLVFICFGVAFVLHTPIMGSSSSSLLGSVVRNPHIGLGLSVVTYGPSLRGVAVTVAHGQSLAT